MLRRGEVMLDALIDHELSEAFVCELCPIISNDYLWYVKPDHNTFLEKLYTILCRNGSQWFSLDPFGEMTD